MLSRLLFTGGRVFTSDSSMSWAEAVVVAGEVIEFVGSTDEALRLAGDDAVRIDAAGGLVMAGFVDVHSRVLVTGDSLLKAQLGTALDLDELQRWVSEWADANPEAPRVQGAGWLFSAVPDGRPTKEMLDAVVADQPVYLEADDLPPREST